MRVLPVPASLRRAGVAVTVAAAVGLLSTTSAIAAQPAGLDHVKCYTIKVTQVSTHATKVTLIDQFGTSRATVAKEPERLCNPVQKTLPNGEVTPVQNPLAHLLCYRIKDSLTGTREVAVENQFGRARLTVGAAQRLCLPTFTSRTSALPAGVAPRGLDHMKCYAARYSTLEVLHFTLPPSVGLKDEFETVKAKIAGPVELCNPVTKVLPSGATTKALNPDAHLVCFAITAQTPPHTSVTIFAKNQFGKTMLDTVKESRLCLPSFKKEVATG